MKKSIGSGRGSVYNIILKALQSGDKYGYEICKEVEEKTNGAYILKQPSLYSGLKRLEAQGDVKSYWKDSALGGRRHYYSLTESGKERIDSSNFNWQDARDDIVGTLFEKSEFEKQIEDVENDLHSINSTMFDENTQQKVDEIIKNTQMLADQNEEREANEEITENKEENQDEYKLNFGDGDLFSMFNNIEPKNEPKENIEKIEEFENIEKENIEKQDNQKLESFEEKQEFNDGKNEQLDLFSFASDEKAGQSFDDKKENSQEKVELTELEKVEQNLTTIEEKQGNDTTLFNIETKEETERDSIEENKDAKILDEKIEIMQKSEEDYTEEYRRKNFEFNSYFDNSLTDTNEDNYFANYFDDSKDLNNQKKEEEQYEELKKEQIVSENLNQQSQNSIKEIDDLFSFSSFNQEQEKKVIQDSQNAEVRNDKEEILAQETEEVMTQEQTKNEEGQSSSTLENSFKTLEETEKDVNLQDIFGDLISKQENQNIEVDDEFVYKTYQEKDEIQNLVSDKAETNLNQEVAKNREAQNVDNLPRNDDALKDINRTLIFDNIEKKEEKYSSQTFESYDQTPFESSNSEKSFETDNPFEKYDTYETLSQSNKQNAIQSESLDAKVQSSNQEQNSSYLKNNSSMAFDKKYANAYNRFEVPDYEVRYFRKNNQDMTSSRFLSINKLNLALSFILSLLISLVTTITIIYVSVKNSFSGFQTAIFVMSYLIALLYLLFNFLKYVSNKNKKVSSLKHVENMSRAFVSITIIILSVAINLFMGMNTDNISSYVGSLVLPVFYAFVIIMANPIKKFLGKFATFYK